MQTPAFFESVPSIVVVDPLAEALGAAEAGVIEYRYVDAVGLAGHSCPTVAGARLMTRTALARRFARPGLLRFGVPTAGEIRFTRLDTGQAVELAHRPQAVGRSAALSGLLQQAFAPQVDATQRKAFADAWQGWVRTILLEHGDDPALIEVLA